MSLSRRSRMVSLLIAMAAACMLFAVVFANGARAGAPSNTYSTAFEAEDFPNEGSPNGQDGWTNTNAAFDHEIEDISNNATAPDGFDNRTFRISNGVASGTFGDQTFSAEVTEAGETDAENGGQSVGPRQTRFESSFEFTSAAPGAEQENLLTVISPDRGDGARMSWIELTDQDGGLRVRFGDYQRRAANDREGGEFCNTSGDSGGGCFFYTPIGENLPRDGVYTVEIVMDFVDGESNDVVRATLKNADGDVIGTHTGTSWEDYFRDVEGNPTRTVDSLLFRTSGTSQTSNTGNGFFIDNLSIETSTPEAPEACTITGTEEGETIEGTPEDDVICALGGDDTVFGLGGNDTIIGGEGDDALYGQGGDDLIQGNVGNDFIRGNSGSDRLFGNESRDNLGGGIGEDRLIGGAGGDRLLGQAGDDFLNTRDGVRGNDNANGGAGNNRCASDPGDTTRRC